MLIADLFEREVTRDINPVIYFHEQDPAKVADEVSEYIVTGGYPDGDPRANEHGIHEQFVRLLTGIAEELEKGEAGGGEPGAWISGFYGSGKSSFAKLLGLSFDGLKLPDGRVLSEALLARDESHHAAEFGKAWQRVVSKITPMAVVFDIGSAARDDEHIHATVVRECQRAMGYCTTSSQVADYEMKLEADGLYADFLKKVKEVNSGRSWDELKQKQLAEDHFSTVLHALRPDLFKDGDIWLDTHAGRSASRSVEESVKAIEHMLKTRRERRTLFLVVDEVSQYVYDNPDRMLKLQSFVMALGQRLKGRVWLLATGQQKLEEGAAANTNLSKMKDRFPPHLRVHLGVSNIRDVVHQRLLKKKHTVREELEELFYTHKPDLQLYAYDCADISVRDFVDTYPLLPGHIDLLLEITSGLHDRNRGQGDSHAIRGLLQMLGDIFRLQDLGRREVGTLITLDRIYDVLHTALDADVQTTLSRAFDFCQKNPEGRVADTSLAVKVLKTVALVELLREDRVKRDATLIGRCLYERVGQGSCTDAIQKTLDMLKAAGFVEYSEKTGYKIQSAAGQEWQKERDSYAVGVEQIGAKVQDALGWSLGELEKPDLNGVGIPWLAWFSASNGMSDAQIKSERSPTRIEVDFRYVHPSEGKKEDWVPRSDSPAFRNRVVWVVGDPDGPREAAIEYVRSEHMIEKYKGSQESLPTDKRRFLTEEFNRYDDSRKALRAAVERAFLDGTLYFRGKDYTAKESGSSLLSVLKDVGDRAVKQLYPSPVTFRVTDSELKFLIDSPDLAAPPPVLGEQKLGILAQDSGRFEAKCVGAVPSEVEHAIKAGPGITGSTLLNRFGGPPHGYSSDVVRACLIGLLRGHKLRVRIAGVGELTSARDEGARELFKDNTLRKAEFFPNKDESITGRDRNAMCKLFEEYFGKDVIREPDDIANAAHDSLTTAREQLTQVQTLLRRIPNKPQPKALDRLETALEGCRRNRNTEPTLKALKRHLDALRDGLKELRRLETDLNDNALELIEKAITFRDVYLEQLNAELEAGRIDDSAVPTAITNLSECLEHPEPWDCCAALSHSLDKLKPIYVERRRAVLAAHQARIEDALAHLKLRDGFDTLGQEEQYQVLDHVRTGAAFDTTAEGGVPSLAQLHERSPERVKSAIEKALLQLDEVRESRGDKPTISIGLPGSGREIDSKDALERFLTELRELLAKEIDAGRRVRLK